MARDRTGEDTDGAYEPVGAPVNAGAQRAAPVQLVPVPAPPQALREALTALREQLRAVESPADRASYANVCTDVLAKDRDAAIRDAVAEAGPVVGPAALSRRTGLSRAMIVSAGLHP